MFATLSLFSLGTFFICFLLFIIDAVIWIVFVYRHKEKFTDSVWVCITGWGCFPTVCNEIMKGYYMALIKPEHSEFLENFCKYRARRQIRVLFFVSLELISVASLMIIGYLK